MTNKMDFKGKRVLIMGLGIQGGGVGMARFFAGHGAKVTVTDLKTRKELKPSVDNLTNWANSSNLKINFVLGKHREEDFKNADLVIRNPDVSGDSPYLKIARDSGIPVEMDESLFLKLCPNLQNVIGVTGTRGKTTTTHLIGAILKKAGYHVLLGGNLRGIAILSLLDKVTPESKVILELSSWQLQGLNEDRISPHIAVVTNIYEDHLNRYKNMNDYIADKKLIFKYQGKNDFLVLNKDNKITKSFAKEAKSKVAWFSKDDVHPAGVFHTPTGWLGTEHNLANLAAAYEVAKIMGIMDEVINRAVGKFSGVKFRLEEIAEINDVTYINDTTSTIPEATIAALRVYEGRPIILICGGFSKNLDLSQMAQVITQKVKTVVLLDGSGTEELISNVKYQIPNSKILGRFNDLKKAVLAAKKVAKPGDVILLSPGFASFGLFKNEYDRGEKFNHVVFSF